MLQPVLILFGPTASGKTAVLERLSADSESPFCKVEIISADSMQVYRGMDIGTAKPSIEEQERIPHHLIDIRNPDEQFNAGEFVRLAEEACFTAFGRGALPIVSGGTGFYLKNLVLGLGEAPPSDLNIRRILREELSSRGAASLMGELAAFDPESAGRIHINDEYRLLRALEVYRLTGKSLSSFASPWTFSGQGEEIPDRPFLFRRDFCFDRNYRFLLIGLRRKREELYERINARTAAMFHAGLADEVKGLYEAGYTPADPGLRAIGYSEFFVPDPGGSWSLSQDLAGVQALVARNSRRYAKRQLTFFSSFPNVNWVDCGKPDQVAEEVHRLLQEFLNSR